MIFLKKSIFKKEINYIIMAISSNSSKLMAWLDRYKITADQLIARIPIVRQRGAVIKAALTQLAPLELPASAGLTVGTYTDTTVALSWTAISGATGYIVQRAKNNKFTKQLTTVYTGSSTSTTDSDVADNTQYYYRVFGTAAGDTVDDIAGANNYATDDVKTRAQLVASESLVASVVTDTTLTLTWEAVTGATGYVLERATNSGFSSGLTTIYTGANLTYDDTGLTPGTTYYYRVHPTAANHNIANYTTESQAMAAALAAPANFAASAVEATTMTLAWDAVTDATGYVLQRATDVGFTTGVTTLYTGTDLTFDDSGLTTATTYYYRVRATKSGWTTVTYATLSQITD